MPAPTAPYHRQEEDQSGAEQSGVRERERETDRQTEEHRRPTDGQKSALRRRVTSVIAITNEEEPQFNSNRITLISDRSD